MLSSPRPVMNSFFRPAIRGSYDSATISRFTFKSYRKSSKSRMDSGWMWMRSQMYWMSSLSWNEASSSFPSFPHSSSTSVPCMCVIGRSDVSLFTALSFFASLSRR